MSADSLVSLSELIVSRCAVLRPRLIPRSIEKSIPEALLSLPPPRATCLCGEPSEVTDLDLTSDPNDLSVTLASVLSLCNTCYLLRDPREALDLMTVITGKSAEAAERESQPGRGRGAAARAGGEGGDEGKVASLTNPSMAVQGRHDPHGLIPHFTRVNTCDVDVFQEVYGAALAWRVVSAAMKWNVDWDAIQKMIRKRKKEIGEETPARRKKKS